MRTTRVHKSGCPATHTGATCCSGMTLTPMEQYEKFVYDAGGTKAIKRIVVANNGMAATKFIMSIRNWLFENFGDERLIHIVAMATPEVSHLSAHPHCGRTYLSRLCRPSPHRT